MSVSSPLSLPPVFVFDAFGTLFDVHAVAREHAAAIGPEAARFSDIWRTKQLEYTWIYARASRPDGFKLPTFAEITRASLIYALSRCGLDAALAPRLLESYQRLPPFPEVRDTLVRLKAGGARLAILSNADSKQLNDLVANAGFNGMFEHLISVSAAGSYKPDPSVYALGPEAFDRLPCDLTFVSSNRWDVAGANAFGYTTVWVNRAGLPDEYPGLPAETVIADLSGLTVDT